MPLFTLYCINMLLHQAFVEDITQCIVLDSHSYEALFIRIVIQSQASASSVKMSLLFSKLHIHRLFLHIRIIIGCCNICEIFHSSIRHIAPGLAAFSNTISTSRTASFVCCQQNSGTTTQAIGGQRLAAAEGNYSHNFFLKNHKCLYIISAML